MRTKIVAWLYLLFGLGDVGLVDVAAAQAIGVKVNLWGVESTPDAMDLALALNADAITLDRPDLLNENLSI